MSLSRRGMLRTLGGLGRGQTPHLVTARGFEALQGELSYYGAEVSMLAPPEMDEVRISSNENPLGPGKVALDAILAQLPHAGRYVFNTPVTLFDVGETIAKLSGSKQENVLFGAGSGEILVAATRAYTSPTKALVTASPSYGQPVQTAKAIGSAIKEVPVDSQMRLDLGAMADAAKGAGLVFFCNPNNPTATAHGAAEVADFVARVSRSSPDTYFLIDEAYCDYVTDPSYKSAFPMVADNPKVIVARTFSKAYGMAGMRLGYAVASKAAIDTMRPYTMSLFSPNILVAAGAHASLNDPAHIRQESQRNSEVRQYTLDFFKKAGYKASNSQTNFIFVDIGRPAKDFRDACAQHKVQVGRDFPPLEKTHARISIGTMDEMKRAVEVFGRVLGASTATSASRD